MVTAVVLPRWGRLRMPAYYRSCGQSGDYPEGQIYQQKINCKRRPQRWTPLFGPRNAEIKLAFQALLGLGFVGSLSLCNSKGTSPISSRKIVPPSAVSKRPARSLIARPQSGEPEWIGSA